MLRVLVAPAIFLFAYAQPSLAQETVRDCLAVLSKDYYSYAQRHDLQEDFLKTIDSESWEQLRKDQKAGVKLFEVFDFSDQYSTFSEKRNRYLETVHYARNEQQALNILQITTADRAYPAYEACLRTVAGGTPLRVWASRESMDEIELRVRYNNPSGVRSIAMQGLVSGGTVTGAGPGKLWGGNKRFGVNQETVVTIRRTPGTSTTTAIVVPSDGSSPMSVSFRRADAVLLTKYVGTVDAFRQERTVNQPTPNNDHNAGNCPNMVGKDHGRWCISRTPATITTSAPRVLRGPTSTCSGGACDWARLLPPRLENNGLTAVGEIDNWGSSVTLVLKVQEFERMDEQSCGHDGPVPIIKGEATVLSIRKECQPIATLEWKHLVAGGGGAGTIRFGEQGGQKDPIVRVSAPIDNGTAVIATYRLK